MGMMPNAGPYGAPYGQAAGQVMGQQLPNKAAMPNSLAQFNMDKKPQPVQGMAAMVIFSCHYPSFIYTLSIIHLSHFNHD